MIKKSDFGPDKSIDQLIEEELVVCEVCKGSTEGRDIHCFFHLDISDVTHTHSSYVLARVKPKQKQLEKMSGGNLAAGLMNLTVCCLVGFIVILVLVEMFR